MVRLSREVLEANGAIADATRGVENIEETLRRALEIAQDCARAYADGTPMVRRLMNQGLFEKLYIDEDGSVERYEVTEPFSTLFDPGLLEQLSTERDDAEAAVGAEDLQETDEGTRLRCWYACSSVRNGHTRNGRIKRSGRIRTSLLWYSRADSNRRFRLERAAS
jgi:hypothetical protein